MTKWDSRLEREQEEIRSFSFSLSSYSPLRVCVDVSQ